MIQCLLWTGGPLRLRTADSYLLHQRHHGGILHTVYSRAHTHKQSIASLCGRGSQDPSHCDDHLVQVMKKKK